MSQTQPRSGMYAWDEHDARSIASNTPSYGGALFAAYPAVDAVLPQPRPRVSRRFRLATRLKVLIRRRARPARVGG